MKISIRPHIPQKAAPKAQPQPQPKEEFDPGDATIIDVANGVGGAIVAAGIETVGNTVSSVFQAAELLVESEVALVKNKTLGPWVRGGLALLAPLAAGLSVAATAVGSLGYGLYQGFTTGLREGVVGAGKQAAEDVVSFNKDLAGGVREGIREFGNETLEEGEEPFDVSPIKGLIGVGAGIGTAVQGAARVGWSTTKNIPQAFKVANREIKDSEWSAPLKVASHVLSVPIAAVAAPLAVAGGGLAGLAAGTYHGYADGFTDAFKKVDEYADWYDDKAAEVLADEAEDLTGAS